MCIYTLHTGERERDIDINLYNICIKTPKMCRSSETHKPKDLRSVYVYNSYENKKF